jgi:hypothetical protein
MSDTLKPKIEYLIRKGNSILDWQYQPDTSKSQSEPLRELVQDVKSTFWGDVATDLFETSFAGKTARKYIKLKNQKQKVAERQGIIKTLEAYYISWADEVKSLISSISICKKGLNNKGNSRILLKKFLATQHFSKVETKIRHGIAFLEELGCEQLVYNIDIPQLLQKEGKIKQKDAYSALKHLETKLRGLIQSKLSPLSDNWWKERIPSDVQQRAQERKNRNEGLYPWYEQRDLHLIFYVDFTDYSKIILRKDNWEQIFSKVFKDKEIVSAKLKELEHIRNNIAHSRELKHQEIQKLVLYSKDLLFCIG